MLAILRKEITDYFTSIRCFILFIIIFLITAGAVYAAQQGVRAAAINSESVFLALFTASGDPLPSLVQVIALFIPVIGITLGFDAINREHNNGTMSRILSQPVYRDNVINGKFLAGVITLYIMLLATLLLVSGYGLRMIGVFPSPEEIIRLFSYFIFAVIYGAFWIGLAILFSVLIRNLAISLLCPLAIWIFLGNPIFNPYLSFIVPNVAHSIGTTLLTARFSPYFLFQESTMAILLPHSRGLGILESPDLNYMLPNPLPLDQSILIVWPQLTILIGLAAVCFAISYIVFMRQEIRAT